MFHKVEEQKQNVYNERCGYCCGSLI